MFFGYGGPTMKGLLRKHLYGEFSIWRSLLNWIGIYALGVMLVFSIDALFSPNSVLFFFNMSAFVAILVWFTAGCVVSGYKRLTNPTNGVFDRISGGAFLLSFLGIAYLLVRDLVMMV